MNEPEPPSADVLQFVGRGVRAQNAVDAVLAGTMVGLVRQQLLLAIALKPPASTIHLRQALNELGALQRALAEHFDRLGTPSEHLSK